MKIWASIATLLVTMTLTTGCGGGGSTEGRFVSESNPQDILQLRSDGRFFQEEGGRSFSGTYKISGTEIILTLPSGAVSKGTINGDVLVDPGGDRWVKVGSTNETGSGKPSKSGIGEYPQQPSEQVLQLLANLTPNDIPAPWELTVSSPNRKRDIAYSNIGFNSQQCLEEPRFALFNPSLLAYAAFGY